MLHLNWSGRSDDPWASTPLPPVREVHPARHPPLEPPPTAGGRLYAGDNLEVMAGLLPQLEGRVDLVYVDPPFSSNADYNLSPQAGGGAAYTDRWAGGLEGYLSMLWPRLRLIHRLLAPTGSLYVHLDPTAAHYVKVLLDELFGAECFQREIIWRIGWISGYKSTVANWCRNHDTILFYTRSPGGFTFNKPYVPHPPGYQRRGGGEGRGRPVEDIWNGNAAEAALTGAESLDSIQIKSFSREKTGYPTQKNESLLRRIVAASSNPGDLVADFFCGSGTTLVAAEALDRRWLGCDAGATAIHVTRKRLLGRTHCGPWELAGPPAQQGDAIRLLPLGDAWTVQPPPGADWWAVDWDHDGGPLRPSWSGPGDQPAPICHRPEGAPPRAVAQWFDANGNEWRAPAWPDRRPS